MIRIRGRTIILWSLILFSALPLMGCSSTHYRNRIHPEYGQADFDRDWYECRRENTRAVAESYRYAYGLGVSGVRTEVDEGMAMACFRARGWYPTKD